MIRSKLLFLSHTGGSSMAIGQIWTDPDGKRWRITKHRWGLVLHVYGKPARNE